VATTNATNATPTHAQMHMQMRFLCLLEQRLRGPMEIVNFSYLLSQPSRNYAKRAKSCKNMLLMGREQRGI